MTGATNGKRKNSKFGTIGNHRVQRLREDFRVTLRVPPRLYDQLKGCATVSGSTVNSMVCIAISEYLVSRGIDVDGNRR